MYLQYISEWDYSSSRCECVEQNSEQKFLVNHVSLFDLQLHNVTLALDLLNDTGLQVSSVDPQGDEITHCLLHTIHAPPCRLQIRLKLKCQAQKLKKTKTKTGVKKKINPEL